MRKLTIASLSVLCLVLAVLPLTAADSGSWTGEVVDMACYVASGAKGADHADCAKKCVKNGEPMGLLTADGDLFLLAASHDDASPFEALKDLAGEQAMVKGSLAKRDGVPMITVTGAGAAK